MAASPFFSAIAITSRVARRGVKGAVFGVHLDLRSSPRHFIIELGTSANAVRWSFVPELMGLGSLVTGACNRAPPNRLSIRYCSPRNITCLRVFPIFSEILAGAIHHCPASIRTLNGPLLGPVPVGVRFKAQVHHRRDGLGLLGAAIYREVSWTSAQSAVSRTM